MTTKKKSTDTELSEKFFVYDVDGQFIDECTDLDELDQFVHHTLLDAETTARDTIHNNSDVANVIVYKLVPVLRIKKADIIVEKL